MLPSFPTCHRPKQTPLLLGELLAMYHPVMKHLLSLGLAQLLRHGEPPFWLDVEERMLPKRHSDLSWIIPRWEHATADLFGEFKVEVMVRPVRRVIEPPVAYVPQPLTRKAVHRGEEVE